MNPRKIPPLKPRFVERMQQLLPDESDYNSYLEILKQEPVKSIRCNKLKISPKELKEKLEAKGWKIKQPWKDYPEVMIVEGKIAHPSDSSDKTSLTKDKLIKDKLIKQSEKSSFNNFHKSASDSEPISRAGGRERKEIKENIIDLSPGELGRALEHLLGYYYIQELASMLPIIIMKPEQDETILDLCASPGSKTTQTASEMFNSGTIIANEVNMGRLKILASNLERCGVTNTIITRKDGILLCRQLKKQGFNFNKILVDAPCSGEGTLRSSPKTYIMWNPKTIKKLSRLQIRLVESALEILNPNGTLIYSTCTHAPEENEGVVNNILEKFKGKVKLEKIKLPIKHREGITKWKDKEFSKEVKKCARIYPHDADTEGFFIAKFRRLG